MIHASAVSTPMIAVTANRLRAPLTQAGERTTVVADAERLLLSEWLLRLTEQGDYSQQVGLARLLGRLTRHSDKGRIGCHKLGVRKREMSRQSIRPDVSHYQ
jgi:hypothetical protein